MTSRNQGLRQRDAEKREREPGNEVGVFDIPLGVGMDGVVDTERNIQHEP